MRKEYHTALAKIGLDFNYIAEKLKNEINTASKSSDRLAGISILLKSIGLDRYTETSIAGGGWEEVLLQMKSGDKNKTKFEVADYKVIEPLMPENIRIAKEKAIEESKHLYD